MASYSNLFKNVGIAAVCGGMLFGAVMAQPAAAEMTEETEGDFGAETPDAESSVDTFGDNEGEVEVSE